MNTDTWNGTSGDDIINAPFDYAASTPSPTINALDYIDAGAGNDTLNIEGNQSIVGTFKNIENVFFKGIDAASTTTGTYSRGIDASKFSGVEKIWVDGGNLSDATATNALTVTNLTDAITFGLKGNVVTDQGAGSPDLITLQYKSDTMPERGAVNNDGGDVPLTVQAYKHFHSCAEPSVRASSGGNRSRLPI